MRNYNENPIIIQDNNSLFLFLFAIYFIPFLIVLYFFNPGGLSEKSLSFNVFIIMPILILPYAIPYYKSKNRRKIVLKNESIEFFHKNILIESIDLNDVTEIQKTYSDIYHRSQYPNVFGKFLSYIFFPVIGLIHILLILNKFLFHIFKDGYKSYYFFDAIIVFSEDKFINILPTTLSEYHQIEIYMMNKKQIEIKKIKAYFYFYTYMAEKINFTGE